MDRFDCVWLLMLHSGLRNHGYRRSVAGRTSSFFWPARSGRSTPASSGALEEGFEKETGIRVRHVGAGTGAALKMAESGQFDLVLAHAKALEEKFVQDGFGTQRIPLMYNDFVIVGPAADPAGIKGMKTAAEALKTIAAKGVTFISRGDKSGTHVAEMDLWAKAGIKPAGAWYVVYEKGSTGNVPTLLYTDEKQAYTVIDRATYLSVRQQDQTGHPRGERRGDAEFHVAHSRQSGEVSPGQRGGGDAVRRNG